MAWLRGVNMIDGSTPLDIALTVKEYHECYASTVTAPAAQTLTYKTT